MSENHPGFRLRQILAFAAVYVIWGSTYLAIRFAIETLPGFTMAGARFLIAGGILYAIARLTGAPRPEWVHWRTGLLVGGMLFLGGNGLVVWSEQHLASGLAALLVGTEPLWIALILWTTGRRPSPMTLFALIVGFLGAALLAAPSELVGGEPVYFPAVLAILIACASWAAGSLYGPKAPLPKGQVMATAVQMLGGGALLLLTGAVLGETSHIDPSTWSTKSLLAFAYLVVFGSLVAFSAYSFLMRTTEPTLVSTYAYVNPVVAVFLGWLLANEPFGPRTVVATVLIVGSVVAISLAEARRRRLQEAAAKAPVVPIAVEPAREASLSVAVGDVALERVA